MLNGKKGLRAVQIYLLYSLNIECLILDIHTMGVIFLSMYLDFVFSYSNIETALNLHFGLFAFIQDSISGNSTEYNVLSPCQCACPSKENELKIFGEQRQ